LSNINKIRPKFNKEESLKIVENLYHLEGTIKELPSERDQNYLVKTTTGDNFVLKIAASSEKRKTLEFQNDVMNHISNSVYCPKVVHTRDGEQISVVTGTDNRKYFVRLLSYLPGDMFGSIKNPASGLLFDLGRTIASLTRSLQNYSHPAAKREFPWDLKNATSVIWQYRQYVSNKDKLDVVNYFLDFFEREIKPYLPRLKESVIHNDANDYNLVIDHSRLGKDRIGIIDFGDMVYSYTIGELAITIAYAILGKSEPLYCATHIIRGYNSIIPLTEIELDVLFSLICMRLCVSVSISSYQKNLEPENDYLKISETPAWDMLFYLRKIPLHHPSYVFKQCCNLSPSFYDFPSKTLTKSQLLEKRNNILGRNLSISYKNPLKIVKGYMQYLYDEDGQTYLDMRNNVPHVGHSHPKVVWALQKQAAVLNTNTRYLQENLIQYTERLLSYFPPELSVCYFVNSGSEANELALRLARTHTGRNDILAIEGAYHGNTGELVNISHHKFSGKGGKGQQEYVHTVKIPDVYRGTYRTNDPKAGEKYAKEVEEKLSNLQDKGIELSAFIFESILGSTGHHAFPKNYLKDVFQFIHEFGGICIADEVQVGFGRVGTHFWGFEKYGVVPDIVTLGKPIGNGHPLAAVITTKEIADSFNNGMEFFSTTGGNSVSCAVGMAVLNIIEEENLQENALTVGNYIISRIKDLKEQYQIIGDIRGSGLFLGIEMIEDLKSLSPAISKTEIIVEEMKNRGVLIGNAKNTLKIKPPMVFTIENAEFFIQTLEKVLIDKKL
jgi:4-aminobutyrate aminotransferase-like enzyme/Ser/Thr protein kinase RdoA (MazF antagonist)